MKCSPEILVSSAWSTPGWGADPILSASSLADTSMWVSPASVSELLTTSPTAWLEDTPERTALPAEMNTLVLGTLIIEPFAMTNSLEVSHVGMVVLLLVKDPLVPKSILPAVKGEGPSGDGLWNLDVISVEGNTTVGQFACRCEFDVSPALHFEIRLKPSG